MKNGRWVAIVLAAIATPVLLLLLYGTAYLCMLIIDYPSRYLINEATGQLIFLGRGPVTTASYRFGGSASQTFFAPAEALDQKLRPDLWDPLKPLKDSGGFALPPPDAEPGIDSRSEPGPTAAEIQMMRTMTKARSQEKSRGRRGAEVVPGSPER